MDTKKGQLRKLFRLPSIRMLKKVLVRRRKLYAIVAQKWIGNRAVESFSQVEFFTNQTAISSLP